MILMSTINPPLKIGLQILGIWPDMPYTTFYRLIYMLSILTIHYFQYLYLFARCKFSDLQNLVRPLSVTLYYILTILKLIILWMNCSVIREILVAMDTDWRECVNIDQHLHLMRTKASNSQFCTIFLLSFNLLAAAIYFGGDNIIAIIHLLKGDNYTSRPFPIKVLLPSEAEQSPFYELLVVLLFMHAMLTVYTVAIINALISALVFHVSGQIDIIHQELKAISMKVSYNESAESTLGMLITKHNKIIEFAENIDKLFAFIAMLQVFSNTSIICLLALIAIKSINSENEVGLLQSLLAYAGITGEIFIYCFIGEYLGLKSRALADAGYNSLWYNMSPRHSKNIIFIIMRSQKQLTITVGGLMNLSLDLFTSIMKASASYTSILHAMY
ncbi:odorant receptor 22c-like [Odontomachus brunneus]|uniref:odorant receptor 22c-like n=1 Tax=Odontomachus brunneus TaxID=486640 RepID=UPI0013F29732|nr:odorant receptor 22c-like [Odontomachus brunneus]